MQQGNWNAQARNYLYAELKRAQECRELHDKLPQASGAGREEITNAMKAIGCTAPAPVSQ